MSIKLNIPFNIQFGKRESSFAKNPEELLKYNEKFNEIKDIDEGKLIELFYKFNKIDNIGLIDFVYGTNSTVTDEDEILEEEFKYKLNQYILSKKENNSYLEDYQFYDILKDGVIGKLIGNFNINLLFDKALKSKYNKFPENITFVGGGNKDNIKRKENACEISIMQEIKIEINFLLHKIIYYFYKYMSSESYVTYNSTDTESISPFNFRIKLIELINTELSTKFEENIYFKFIIEEDIEKRSTVFSKDKTNIASEQKDRDYSVFDEPLLYLLKSDSIRKLMCLRLLELQSYKEMIIDTKKGDKDRKIAANVIFLNILDKDGTSLKKTVKPKPSSGVSVKNPSSTVINVPDPSQISINKKLFNKSNTDMDIRDFDFLDCYELFIIKKTIFKLKAYLEDEKYCPFIIEKNILSNNMKTMDLWDTEFPTIEKVTPTPTEADKIFINTQFLLMVKFYNILAILFEKINEKIPDGIIYSKK